jgi:hypothetical protein
MRMHGLILALKHGVPALACLSSRPGVRPSSLPASPAAGLIPALGIVGRFEADG